MDAASDQKPEGQSEETSLATVEIVTPTLFGSQDPDSIIEKATGHAKALAGVIDKQDLYVTIKTKQGPRKHVRVEGWTLLGSMLGVFPVERSTVPEPEDWRSRGMDRPDGYVSVVEARTRDGEVVGRANARCMRSEKRWEYADEYAIASMAQTRATSKALRMPLGFIVALAGFAVTPAEEVVDVEGESWDQAEPAKQQRSAQKTTAKKTTAKKSKKTDPAPKETWDEAIALYGARKDVIDTYRDLFKKTGSVSVKDVTEDELRKVIALKKGEAA
jgi:hypothetical protein